MQITGIMKRTAFHLSLKEARTPASTGNGGVVDYMDAGKPAALSWSLISVEIETREEVNRSTKVATVLRHKTGGELGVCLT